MSTLSPQFVPNDSPNPAKLNDASFPDPYLSAQLDPEVASFRSSAIRLTPVSGEDHGSRDASSSPIGSHVHSDSPRDEAHPASYSEYLSPTDDLSSEMSVHTSPTADYLSAAFSTDLSPDSNSWQYDGGLHPGMRSTALDPNELNSAQMIMDPSQLLTPNLTNKSSLSSETTSIKNQTGPVALQNQPQALTLITGPPDECLDVPGDLGSPRARSPIVKIESFSRGDSPVRDMRRPSHSSTHLSPGGPSSESDEEAGVDNSKYLGSVQSVSRGHDGSWIPNAATGHAGVDPTSRKNVYVPSPNELELRRQLDEKNEDIRSWSASVSVANSENGDDPTPHRGRKHTGNRRRAKSAGDPSLQQDYFNLKVALIPGPGVLVTENSEEEYSDHESEIEGTGSETPAASVNEARWVLGEEEIQLSPEGEEPSPHQFLGRPPWRDLAPVPSPDMARTQPASSTAAMVEYERRVRDLDNVSRAATWGTRDVDINSLLGGGGSFENLAISNDKSRKHERRSSLRKLLHRKSSNNLKPPNNLKRHLSDLSISLPGSDDHSKGDENKSSHQRKNSFPHRKLSLGLSPRSPRSSRSPSLSTGGAVIAIAGQMAAIGGKDTLRVASPSSTSNPWPSLKVRGRSRSEIPRPSTPGLIDLMTSHGGPPVANIAYSHLQPEPRSAPPNQSRLGHGTSDGDENDDNVPDERGLVMDLSVQSRLPVPTLEGFRTQIAQLNPRLQPALLDRFANEQVRRYKKLVENKFTHTCAVSEKGCASGKFCFAQGGEALLLTPRAGPQDSETPHTQFQIPGHGEAGDDSPALGESAVTAAQFPPGVPLPPVKRLPAEFECPICFQVKKFQKPSDWTKHVHEDVQPFTCTFAHCSEPKSFKRKADWVRHESERHRQLEWWTCSEPDCNHTCFRKDNFVQHLVREHKMPEPKVKKTKAKGLSKHPVDPNSPEVLAEIQREREIEQLWNLVEQCRHDNPKGPKDEPCRFCGNVCSSWKKLTVHLAKHMEQIAMPVLALVNERDLSSNLGPGSTGKGDLGPEPESISRETTNFAPNLNGVQARADMSIGYTQATYPGHDVGQSDGLGVPFSSTGVPHFTTMSGAFISAEPEPMDAYDEYSVQGGLQPGGPMDQSRLMPMHQNSVTYPPPFNAGPRPRVSNQDMSVLQESYNFSMSPTEMQPTYDPQYMSSTGENSYVCQGTVAPTMPFTAPGAYPNQL
ncbi:unnamed protein product [Aspergillus oryzae var. brunneus]|uniref:Unnamed protein product n=2 Tax=Aspergillus oryzae TaxID=5062 RepID=A0A1S9DFW6_ASPOZ|nr:hypothetical protein OAory_01044450 [Aspergillus oryzae]GMG34055.1 unnamed protein product [Aspergillus oryzae]GMG52059.1 unnamed protein product [Aspergillus oryzae var. brunneus]